MYRYIIEDTRHVPPFNEPASLLTIGTKPLKLLHEDLFMNLFRQNLELGATLSSRDDIRSVNQQAIVYRDNLWFDSEFLEYFMRVARTLKRACRAAIPADDPAYRTYTLPLSSGFERGIDTNGNPIYLLDLWYFPNGYTDDIVSVVVPSDAKEKGFYSVPDFMSMEQGDLTHYLPMRAVLSIESWVHVYFANTIFGVFARGSRFEEHVKTHNFFTLKLLWKGVLEQKQVLSTSEVVRVGKNTVIHPSAEISGPTTIGDNCFIGPGVVIDNCTIGDHVTIDQGCQLMLSTIGNNCFLPFRAALYLTAVMESTIIAQNACLQMCVIGRNSFVGAGNTFTDFNLVAQKPIRAANINGDLESIGQIVLGGAVGHNCRVGSGMVIFPGRMIESDVVLVASPQRRVISRNVTFEESDHHFVRGGDVHKRFYPRPDERHEEGGWNKW
ncbi:MAG: multidrug transporter [Burkholderiales bacterium]|nr:multidrug transporter [Anaerolineae bacterium]